MQTQQAQPMIRNGVDVTALTATIDAVTNDPALAEFQFRSHNQWLDGGQNRSRIQAFYGCRQEDGTRPQPFVLDNDEPQVLLGRDTAPNPVEYILHALAGCMTTSLVYHAAARGIDIAGVETTLCGDLDLRGFLGLSDNVRKGYRQIDVAMRVKSDAPVEQLRQCVGYSPVFEMMSRALPIKLRINIDPQ